MPRTIVPARLCGPRPNNRNVGNGGAISLLLLLVVVSPSPPPPPPPPPPSSSSFFFLLLLLLVLVVAALLVVAVKGMCTCSRMHASPRLISMEDSTVARRGRNTENEPRHVVKVSGGKPIACSGESAGSWPNTTALVDVRASKYTRKLELRIVVVMVRVPDIDFK